MSSHFMSRIVRVSILVVMILYTSLFPASTARADNGSFAWARNMGGTNFDYAYELTVDSNGNLYTVGVFQGTADFDPGPGTYNLTSAGLGDIFVAKLNDSGSFLWARAMGGANHDGIEGLGLAVDGSGNVYTTGHFRDTADFDPGAGTYNLTSAGGDDIFIAKLDSYGDFAWAHRIGGIDNDYAFDIAVDSDGNLYTTGSFFNTIDFDPGAGTFNLSAAGNDDIFISKLDNSGNFIWAERLGGVNNEAGDALSLDTEGNVYSTGRFSGTADFDPAAGTFNLVSAGIADVFIAKLDNDGGFLWARGMGGVGFDNSFGLAVDASGNVFTTGDFGSTVDFDPGGGIYNLTSVGFSDIFLSKLDSSGDFAWARSMGGTEFDSSNSLVLDASGHIYLTGNFGSTVDFDPGPGTYNLTDTGFQDIFVSKLDGAGGFVWAKGMGGAAFETGSGLALSNSGNVYVTGHFGGSSGGTVDFDPGPGTANLTSAGGQDLFIVKLLEADSYEPDNSRLEAKQILDSVPQMHSITPATDVDWVKFTLPNASAVRLETGGTIDADTQMALYASSDLVNPIGYNNDKDYGGGSHYSHIEYNCVVNELPAGTYYVKVDEVGSDAEIADYQLSLYAGACASTPTFGDVPEDYWAGAFVERLYGAGITGGCSTSPLNYCPEQSVTRAQMAVFLLRGIHTSSYTPPAIGAGSGFGDVPADYWAGTWIKQLAAEGITSGCGGGNYCPENPVTRAQMAVFLLRSKYGASYSPPALGTGTGFGDVPPDYWAAVFIKQLVADGITAGCGSGNYCPEQPVTRAQMAVLLIRTFNLP